MQPRVLYRTHYQVEEPAYMELLLRRCTSALEANYSERVAQCLAQEIFSRGRRFNTAAGAYAVDLARGLSIINENNTWTDKGQLLALCATVSDRPIESECELDATERVAHFRLFLDADGAALLHIARIALTGDMLPRDGDWNSFAQSMFADIFQEYLSVSPDIVDRLNLRNQLDRFRVPFSGKTGSHKSYIHCQALARFGLLDRFDNPRAYRISQAGARALRTLTSRLPTVTSLEDVVNSGEWAEIAAVVFDTGRADVVGPPEILHMGAQVYQRIVGSGVSLCSLVTLFDVVQVNLLARGQRPPRRAEILSAVLALQKDYPRDVRFHVDRRGRPAFIKMADGLVAQLSCLANKT